jgi:hypothetical protein
MGRKHSHYNQKEINNFPTNYHPHDDLHLSPTKSHKVVSMNKMICISKDEQNKGSELNKSEILN